MYKGIEHQQNVAEPDLIVVLVRAASSDIGDVAPLVDELKRALISFRPGTVVQVTESSF